MSSTPAPAVVWSVSLTSKAKKLVASMKPGLDNLAFDSRGRLFVTSMTDNGIYLVDKQTGAHRTIVEGKLAIPSDLAVVSEGGKDTVHVADVFSYRTVDGQTGAVADVLRVRPRGAARGAGERGRHRRRRAQQRGRTSALVGDAAVFAWRSGRYPGNARRRDWAVRSGSTRSRASCCGARPCAPAIGWSWRAGRPGATIPATRCGNPGEHAARKTRSAAV